MNLLHDGAGPPWRDDLLGMEKEGKSCDGVDIVAALGPSNVQLSVEICSLSQSEGVKLVDGYQNVSKFPCKILRVIRLI